MLRRVALALACIGMATAVHAREISEADRQLVLDGITKSCVTDLKKDPAFMEILKLAGADGKGIPAYCACLNTQMDKGLSGKDMVAILEHDDGLPKHIDAKIKTYSDSCMDKMLSPEKPE